MRKSVDWLELLLLAMASVIVIKVLLWTHNDSPCPPTTITQPTEKPSILDKPDSIPDIEFGKPSTGKTSTDKKTPTPKVAPSPKKTPASAKPDETVPPAVVVPLTP